MIWRDVIDLNVVDGTMLKPEGRPGDCWKKIREEEKAVLVLEVGGTAAALALKVWPDLASHIVMIVFAGGTLKRGDATPYAENNVYRDPCAVESLLNTGVPVVFATVEAAKKRKMTTIELANDFAENHSSYEIHRCGIHVEIDENARTYGKLICDHISDNKFEEKNAAYIV